MKEGKPEVLIIGEIHPSNILSRQGNLQIKKMKMGKLQFEIVVPDTGKETEASKILEKEIQLIKNFGGKRILWEHGTTPRLEKICAHFQKTKNLENFNKGLISSALLENRDDEKDIAGLAEWIGFTLNKKSNLFIVLPFFEVETIIKETGIYDINFYEDYHLLRWCGVLDFFLQGIPRLLKEIPELNDENRKLAKQLLDRLKEIREAMKETLKQRDNASIKNLKKKIIDKTVIICGFTHAKAIAGGLKDVAFVAGAIKITRKGTEAIK